MFTNKNAIKSEILGCSPPILRRKMAGISWFISWEKLVYFHHGDLATLLPTQNVFFSLWTRLSLPGFCPPNPRRSPPKSTAGGRDARGLGGDSRHLGEFEHQFDYTRPERFLKIRFLTKPLPYFVLWTGGFGFEGVDFFCVKVCLVSLSGVILHFVPHFW